MTDLLDPNVKNTNSPNSGNEKLPNFIAILVLGIVSIVSCYPLGVPGIICGVIGLSLWKKNKALYDQNPEKYASYSYKNAKAGSICAIIGISVSSAWLFFWLLMLIGGSFRF